MRENQTETQTATASAPTGCDTLPSAYPVRRLLSYQVENLQGIGTRTGQEDSFAFVNAMDVTEIKKNGLLALMADGMGGMEDGKQVSETAIAALIKDFHRMDRRKNMGRQLRESVYRVNDLLFERFNGSGGTTLVACIIFQEALYFTSVGDSFLYLKRGNGIYRLNREQTFRQELYLQAIEDGNLDPSLADEDPDAPRLSEFLGKDELDEVDCLCKPWRLRDGDILLLCSDGVGAVLSESTLLDCLNERTPELSCMRIKQEIEAQARIHQDNFTALIIACKY